MTTTTQPHGIGAVRPENWAYDRAPMIVYWELTNACGLACRHCRATAMPDPAPGELTLAEIEEHLDAFAAFGEPKPTSCSPAAIRFDAATSTTPSGLRRAEASACPLPLR